MTDNNRLGAWHFLAGAIGAVATVPFKLAISALYAWGLTAAYDFFIYPWFNQYGLPEITFWQWMAVYIIIGLIKAPFAKHHPGKEPSTEMDKAYLTRLASVLTMILCLYIIHWLA